MQKGSCWQKLLSVKKIKKGNQTKEKRKEKECHLYQQFMERREYGTTKCLKLGLMLCFVSEELYSKW